MEFSDIIRARYGEPRVRLAETVGHTRPWPTTTSGDFYRSVAMIFSMFRSASAVMVTNGLTLVLPGISEPSMT